MKPIDIISRRLAFRVLLLGWLGAAMVSGQTSQQQTAPAILTVRGDIPSRLTLNAEDLAKMPRETVSIPDQDGTKVAYEGVPLREILKRAGAPTLLFGVVAFAATAASLAGTVVSPILRRAARDERVPLATCGAVAVVGGFVIAVDQIVRKVPVDNPPVQCGRHGQHHHGGSVCGGGAR